MTRAPERMPSAHRLMTPGTASEKTLQLLRSVAARADGEGIAALRSDEQAFAMTLTGRRLLERIRLDGNAFRLSSRARELLTHRASAATSGSDAPARHAPD